MNDNKRNFYGVWWGKKKRIKKNHPLAFLNIASEIEIEWSGEQKHSIPFGSDTIGGKKRGDPKPILASEKHNVSLYMPSPSRRLFGLFGNIFLPFWECCTFFFLLLPIAEPLSKRRMYPEITAESRNTKNVFLHESLESLGEEPEQRRNTKMPLPNTAKRGYQRYVSFLPSRSAIGTRITMEFTERTPRARCERFFFSEMRIVTGGDHQPARHRQRFPNSTKARRTLSACRSPTIWTHLPGSKMWSPTHSGQRQRVSQCGSGRVLVDGLKKKPEVISRREQHKRVEKKKCFIRIHTKHFSSSFQSIGETLWNQV